MLFKEIVDGRTHARTDGRRTPDIEGSQKLTEHFVLRWAKNTTKKKIEQVNTFLIWIVWFMTTTNILGYLNFSRAIENPKVEK